MTWNSREGRERLAPLWSLEAVLIYKNYQEYRVIRIVNLHYEDTVKTDGYLVLRERINLFETVVGRLQRILARLPGAIKDTVLAGREDREASRARAREAVERQARETEAGGEFDLDEGLAEDLTIPKRANAPVTFDDLDRVIAAPELMPPATEARALQHQEYALIAPGMEKEIRVTTNQEYYEEHTENMELWSPGNPLFTGPEHVEMVDIPVSVRTLGSVLD